MTNGMTRCSFRSFRLSLVFDAVRRSVYSQKLACEMWHRSNRRVNPECLSDEVRIKGADNDPGMIGLLIVKSDEMLSVKCQHCPTGAGCKCQNRFIADGLIRLPRFEHGQNVVAQPSQFDDNRSWEIFVGVNQRHDHASSLSRICRSISSRWPLT